MAGQPAAEDPGRYHPESQIRHYLAAKPANAATPELLLAAVHERWAVKTAADADAQALTSQSPTATTIAEMRGLPVPAFLPSGGRTDGAEKTVWQLTATLKAFRGEADGDYHLVIADDQGSTMIAEIPKPGDITAPSFFAEQIATARVAFDDYFKLSENINEATSGVVPAISGGGQFRQVTVPVTLTGIGFFDFNHGQDGVAPNAIEIHPVINIAFGG